MSNQEHSDQYICAELVKRVKASPDGWAEVLVDGERHRVHLKDNVLRFVGNPITRKLYDMAAGKGPPWKGYGLNEIVPEFWNDRWSLRRFYIDIAYSLSGFCELSCNHDPDEGEDGPMGAALALPQ